MPPRDAGSAGPVGEVALRCACGVPSADFGGYRGAFCQYKTAAADGLIRIPDALATRPAALAEPTAITLHALHLADVRPDDRVLVTGAGPVGP